jgi:hypothetical protein
MQRVGLALLVLVAACARPSVVTIPAAQRSAIEARFNAAYGFRVHLAEHIDHGVATLSLDSTAARALMVGQGRAGPMFNPMAAWLWRELGCPKAVRWIEVESTLEATLSGSWGIGTRVATGELGAVEGCRAPVAL